MKTEIEKEGYTRRIIIFTITSIFAPPLTLYGIFLIKKLMKYAKKNEIDASIEMARASEIESKGTEADVILLTPDLSATYEKVRSKFPNKIVRVIEKSDYGHLNAEKIFKMIEIQDS